MSRLTIRTKDGAALKLDNPQSEAEARQQLHDKYIIAMDKLAEYEDAEERGKMYILPCKPGDTVHIVGERLPATIESVSLSKDGVWYAWASYDISSEEPWNVGEFKKEDVGETVFPIRIDEVFATAKKRGE